MSHFKHTAPVALTVIKLLPVSLVAIMLFVACDVSETETTQDAGNITDAGSVDAVPEFCNVRTQALQEALDLEVTDYGAALAIIRPDCPAVTVVTGEQVHADLLYRIGSVSKTYIAATVVALSREGLLSLEDTLDTWQLPVPNATDITVRQLLNHSSGIFNYTEDPAFLVASNRQTPQTPEDLVALATAHPASFEPGTDWEYSNTNYILLGMLIEALTQRALVDVVWEHSIDLVGLQHTYFAGEEDVSEALAPGFDASGRDVTNLYHPSWPWAAGAIVSTMEDTASWIKALYGGDVLDASGRAQLTEAPHNIGGGLSYGLGTMLVSASISAGAGQGVGHNGSIAGYHTMAYYFPTTQTSIAAVVTSDGGDVNAVFLIALLELFGR